MWELDCEESWALKNGCFLTVVLGKTLESPLDCKEIQPVHPKGDQSWVFIGRTDAEAETPILWPHDAKSWLIGKDPDAGRDWGQEEKGNDRGWDGWMASSTRWTWVWVNSGSWWWTGRPGMLWFMGLQRVRHDWVTELNWTELNCLKSAVYLWVHTWYCTFYEIDKYILIHIHHYAIIHSIFNSLKTSVLCLFTPQTLCPWLKPMTTTDLFTVSIVLPFWNVM